MSHVASCGMSLRCSLSELVDAILQMAPEWQDYIEVSETGSLPLENSYDERDTRKTGFSVKIRGGGRYRKDGKTVAPNLPYADAGFYMKEDGSWDALIDPSGLPKKLKDLGTTVLNEVAGQRIENYLHSVNAEIESVSTDGSDKILDVILGMDDMNALSEL